jgi:hypothetical protein
MKRNLFLILAILLASLVAYAADLTGTWNVQGAVPGAPQQLVFTTADGRVLNGTVDGVQILGGYKNADFWFSIYRGGASVQYKGGFNGNTLVLNETSGSQTRTYNYTRAGS